jgi:hypothetical protein
VLLEQRFDTAGLSRRAVDKHDLGLATHRLESSLEHYDIRVLVTGRGAILCVVVLLAAPSVAVGSTADAFALVTGADVVLVATSASAWSCTRSAIQPPTIDTAAAAVMRAFGSARFIVRSFLLHSSSHGQVRVPVAKP